ncbi:MAG: tRNA glutamyl-Q(34) synthetase GluQRS [Rhodoferax sp.]|nr:tRNA glutamyl-Q(34) synthetase GluQRS [Rhodoferax sp.]
MPRLASAYAVTGAWATGWKTLLCQVWSWLWPSRKPETRLSAAGPPQGAKAPSGGSEPHAVGSVGATYRGRFAPSPTGPLHAGSLVAALASWLDAKAHQGQWLVRIEDVDTPRCIPGADQTILHQLAACGLHADEAPVWQSQRTDLYQQALDGLVAQQRAYPCACSRKDVEVALQQSGRDKPRNGELVYPGTCRAGLHGKPARAWRFDTRDRAGKFAQNWPVARIDNAQAATKTIADQGMLVQWTDRRMGLQAQAVEQDVGDFVLRRADGLFAYQLAVVVDDAAQNITHVVRGEDLTDNTARQILLQRALGFPTPAYLHTPLVLGSNGEKLSKQNGAQALDTSTPQAAAAALQQAATALGLCAPSGDALGHWIAEWQHNIPRR